MKIREYKSEIWLPLDPAELFGFFSDAANLEALAPPWLSFRIITPTPIDMKPGARIDYRLKIHGFPVRWHSRINIWEPPHRFVDEQLHGPYRRWIHDHTFVSHDGGTKVCDVVSYAVPLDFITHHLLVRPDIEKIFAFRSHKLLQRFSRKN